MNFVLIIAFSFLASSCSGADSNDQVSKAPQLKTPAPVSIQSNRLTKEQSAAARDVLLMRCSGGHGPSCADLSNMYALGVGGGIDVEKSNLYAKKACEFGFKDSCPK
jgi:TPR repeat protein